MAGISEIEWTDVTWNPVAGCTIASSGCSNCYAMRMAARLQAMDHVKYRGTTRKSGERYVWTGKVNLDESSLSAPLEWRKGKRVFVNSMSDLFHEAVPDEFIAKVWEVMAACPQHHFQVLTKRPARMAALFKNGLLTNLLNVWLGTSVENEEVADRIGELSQIVGATLFISFEPLIGRINDVDLTKIHWAIIGGESGPRARPMEPEWVERLFDICRRDDVAFFFKQWGGRNKKASGRELHGRTYDEYPFELVVD
jgi:protein gp37